MKRKRLGGLAVALALGLGVTSVVPAPVAAAAVEAGCAGCSLRKL